MGGAQGPDYCWSISNVLLRALEEQPAEQAAALEAGLRALGGGAGGSGSSGADSRGEQLGPAAAAALLEVDGFGAPAAGGAVAELLGPGPGLSLHQLRTFLLICCQSTGYTL